MSSSLMRVLGGVFSVCILMLSFGPRLSADDRLDPSPSAPMQWCRMGVGELSAVLQVRLPSWTRRAEPVFPYIPPVYHARSLYYVVQAYRASRPADESPLNFVEAIIPALNIQLKLNAEDYQRLKGIPGRGQIIISNHPTGVVDGAIWAHLLGQVGRKDFKIMVAAFLKPLFNSAPELLPYFVFVERANTPDRDKINTVAFRESLALLKRGGSLIVFPAGRIATTPTWRIWEPVQDAEWDDAVVGFADTKFQPQVIPGFIHTRNSVWYQLANQVSPTLRRAQYFREALLKRNQQINVRIAEPLTSAELHSFGEEREVWTSQIRSIVEGLRTPR